MKDKKVFKDRERGSVNLGQHQAQCTVCKHPDRQGIEEEFITWHQTSYIAERYCVSRDAIYRHANAVDLYSKRRKHIVMALEQIIERVDRTRMDGSDILAAIRMHVKIHSGGEEGEHLQGTDPKELIQRMSEEERLTAAPSDSQEADNESELKAATLSDSQEAHNESEATETKVLQ